MIQHQYLLPPFKEHHNNKEMLTDNFTTDIRLICLLVIYPITIKGLR
jgi:hypothetical protein